MSGDVEGWVPAFPGQRPPFQPGHTLSTQHGAHSPRRVDPLARELVDVVLAEPLTAYLQQRAYQPALWAWARADARAQLLDAWLVQHAEEKDGCLDCKACAPKADQALKWQKAALNHRGRLGLDPLSRARLGRSVAAAQVDMARLLSVLDEDCGVGGDGDDDG